MAPSLNLLKSITPTKRNFLFKRAKGNNLFNNINNTNEYKDIFFSSLRTLFIIDCIISILNITLVFLMFIDYDKLREIALEAKPRRIAIYYSQLAAFQAKTDYGFNLSEGLAEQAVGQLSLISRDRNLLNILMCA